MKVQYEPGLTTTTTPNTTVHLVAPNGLIRFLQISLVVDSPWLDVEYRYNKRKRRIGIKSVRVTQAAAEAGFALLGDLYEQEGMSDGLEKFAAWYAYRAKHKASMPAEIPDEYLPNSVVARRKKTFDADKVPTPPVRPEGPQKRAKGA